MARLKQAEAMALVAELALDDDTETATPGVAAALAVLAGIAASDAACCARLKVRSRGPDHRASIRLLRTVSPHGPELAKDLERLLARKDDAHYGLAFVEREVAAKLVRYAGRMVETSRRLLEM